MFGPTASRTVATLWMQSSTFFQVSMNCISAVAFILTAVKPRSTAARAAVAVSAGRSPPIQE